MKSTPPENCAVSREELFQFLAETPFARIYNVVLQSFEVGECTLIIPFDESLERPGGIVAGSVLMTAADVAMWLAIMTKLGTEVMAVTTEISTKFLRSAKREEVHCTARVVKFGKSLIFGVAECVNPAGKRLAHHTITYIRLDK